MVQALLKNKEFNMPETSYPYLGIYTSDDSNRKSFVVFFTEKNTGVVVYKTEKSPYKVGFYYSKWKESDFMYSDQIVELSN